MNIVSVASFSLRFLFLILKIKGLMHIDQQLQFGRPTTKKLFLAKLQTAGRCASILNLRKQDDTMEKGEMIDIHRRSYGDQQSKYLQDLFDGWIEIA